MENLIQVTNSLTDLDEDSPLNIDLPVAFISLSEKETHFLGLRLAKLLKKGSIVALGGVLGSGKTILAKGICRGLGVKEEITSPTYTIVSEYEGFTENCGKIPVFHIDAYRLGGIDDFSDIGGEEIIFGNGISLIEWS